jgi:hypothetical protein
MTRKEAQEREDSRSKVYSRKGSCQIVTANETDWIVRFSSVIEGASNQEDWSASMVANPVQELELLPGWETELFPGDCRVW